MILNDDKIEAYHFTNQIKTNYNFMTHDIIKCTLSTQNLFHWTQLVQFGAGKGTCCSCSLALHRHRSCPFPLRITGYRSIWPMLTSYFWQPFAVSQLTRCPCQSQLAQLPQLTCPSRPANEAKQQSCKMLKFHIMIPF